MENHRDKLIRWLLGLVFLAPAFPVSGAWAQSSGQVIPVGTTLALAPFLIVNEKNENVGGTPFAQHLTALNGGIVRVAASGLLDDV